ncbi:MAG: TetR/AcrR family transcriptional regulator [Acidobacteria bacterium]|nr:TetR/AcrR family transcriptional regulator [Acidobacteriota bacterium]
MRAKKTRTAIRQEQIVHAALEVIGTDGFHALSLSGIAERVGIGVSSVYRHFGSKDAVLDAVLDMLHRRLLRNVAEVREETPEALERLRRLMERHARVLEDNRAIPHIIMSDGLYAGHSPRKEKIRRILDEYLDQIREILRDGQAEGTIRPEADPVTVSALFLGVLLPAALLKSVSEGAYGIGDHFRRAWPIFRAGIAADSPEGRPHAERTALNHEIHENHEPGQNRVQSTRKGASLDKPVKHHGAGSNTFRRKGE